MILHPIAAPLALAAVVMPFPIGAQAPQGTAATLYCMRIEAVTGSRIERIRCWTRSRWEREGVDLDRDWPREGVRTIEPIVLT